MWILSQNTDIIVDFTAAEIVEAIQENPQTGERILEGWQIVVHSFGVGFPVAHYNNQDIARRIFAEMSSKLKHGDEFFDIREAERKIVR